MNGDGWVCDHCGKTEVVPGIDRAMRCYSVPGPPAGWLVLILIPNAPEMAEERWDFCSLGCVAFHAEGKARS